MNIQRIPSEKGKERKITLTGNSLETQMPNKYENKSSITLQRVAKIKKSEITKSFKRPGKGPELTLPPGVQTSTMASKRNSTTSNHVPGACAQCYSQLLLKRALESSSYMGRKKIFTVSPQPMRSGEHLGKPQCPSTGEKNKTGKRNAKGKSSYRGMQCGESSYMPSWTQAGRVGGWARTQTWLQTAWVRSLPHITAL